MPCRATGTLMHEPSAGVLEKKSGNSTFIDWRRGKGTSTAGSQTLPVELKYAFFEENKQCPVVISSLLTTPQEDNLLHLLKMNKQALGWKISDLKGISPTICTHHIYLKEESKAVRQPQRGLNPHMQEVVRIEVLKLLQVGIIYPISYSTWVSPTQVVPKKSGVTTVKNEKGKDLSTRLTTGWRVCIDYRRLNAVTRKDHFPLH